MCRSPTAGKAIGICKTTGGKATGRCREGIEGARRQSWNRKKKLCADPRQLEKPVARQQVERPLDAAGKGLKGPSGSLGSGKKGSVQIPDSWQSHGKKKAVTDLRQLEKPLAFARNRSKGHLTLHVGNRKNELCADLRQLEKALAFSTQPFQRPFDGAGQGLGVGTGKKSSVQIPAN